MARHFRTDPSVKAAANEIVAVVSPRTFMGEVRALFQWVHDRIEYDHDDTLDTQLLRSPDYLLAERVGACADMSLLLGSMLLALRHPVRFVAVGRDPGVLEHVYVETWVKDTWLALDPTEDEGPGWRPPGMVEKRIVNV